MVRNSTLFAWATISIVLIGLVALSAVAARGQLLSYFGAMDPGRVENDVDAKGSETDECAWVDSRFETFAGVPASVRVTKRPRWEVEFDEIRAVSIHEAIPSPGATGSHPYVFVHLEISEEAQNRIDARRKLPCGNFVRVQHDSRDLDLVPIVGIGAGVLPGGSFGSREEAERFYSSIGERVSYVGLSDDDRAYWQARNVELVEIAAWYAKCDPDYLKSLGDGLYEHIMATPSLRQRSEQADCGVDPPRVPLGAATSE